MSSGYDSVHAIIVELTMVQGSCGPGAMVPALTALVVAAHYQVPLVSFEILSAINDLIASTKYSLMSAIGSLLISLQGTRRCSVAASGYCVADSALISNVGCGHGCHTRHHRQPIRCADCPPRKQPLTTTQVSIDIIGQVDKALTAMERLFADDAFSGSADRLFALVEHYPGIRDVSLTLAYKVCSS